MTLDTAQEAFRANPTAETAETYRCAAAEYLEDGMIGEDTWLAVMRETAEFT